MTNQEESNLEDNLPMVNYIMLHRLYDIITLVADFLAKDDESRLKLSKMIEYHTEGFLLGPNPSFRTKENDE